MSRYLLYSAKGIIRRAHSTLKLMIPTVANIMTDSRPVFFFDIDNCVSKSLSSNHYANPRYILTGSHSFTLRVSCKPVQKRNFADFSVQAKIYTIICLS
jgi:hypothetical protein